MAPSLPSSREERKEIWIHDGMTGMTSARHELLGEQGRQGSAADLCDERLPPGDLMRRPESPSSTFGSRASSICARGPRARVGRARIQSGTPGQHLREPDPPGIGRRAKATCRRPAISALTTSSQALSPGSSTRFRIQASSGMKRGRPDAWKYVGGVEHMGRNLARRQERHRVAS